MVPAARFELTTSKLGILRSILLSYGGIYAKNLTFNNQILSSQKKYICVKTPRHQRPLAMTAWDKFAMQIYLNFSQDEFSLIYSTSKFHFTKCQISIKFKCFKFGFERIFLRFKLSFFSLKFSLAHRLFLAF